jgi:hypothetical protein
MGRCFTEYATMYQAQARECTGCTDCVQPPYEGCFFPPAADPGRPAAYSALWTRDFEYTMEFLYPLFDETSKVECTRVLYKETRMHFVLEMMISLPSQARDKHRRER